MADKKGNKMSSTDRVTKKNEILEKHKDKAENDPKRRLAHKGLKRAQRRLSKETADQKRQDERKKNKKSE